jgi:hypothetical protein
MTAAFRPPVMIGCGILVMVQWPVGCTPRKRPPIVKTMTGLIGLSRQEVMHVIGHPAEVRVADFLERLGDHAGAPVPSKGPAMPWDEQWIYYTGDRKLLDATADTFMYVYFSRGQVVDVLLDARTSGLWEDGRVLLISGFTKQQVCSFFGKPSKELPPDFKAVPRHMAPSPLPEGDEAWMYRQSTDLGDKWIYVYFSGDVVVFACHCWSTW